MPIGYLLDRLVQQAHTLDWRVLDYKSASRLQDQPVLQAQLTQYRAAVAQATRGQTIRAGFLTA